MRHTLNEAFECEGVAIHRGDRVRLAVRPAQPFAGLCFTRVDLDGAPRVRARLESVCDASFATSLAHAGRVEAGVSTVEHLLAALSMAGIDDAAIEIDGPELPVMDGSAAPFAAAIAKAGRRGVDAPRPEIVVTESIAIEDGARRIEVHPHDGLAIEVSIDFDHPAIGRQRIACDAVTDAWFAAQIAPARTFGFLADVGALRAAGRAGGASLDNTLVFDAEAVVNDDGLRFPDEPVRHKALDLLGDLALLGAPLRGRVVVERGGHALHHRLVAAIAAAFAGA